jgi:pimeloyl-ACP methyl ester carboxylesterase
MDKEKERGRGLGNRSPVTIALVGIGFLAFGALLTITASRKYTEQRVVATSGSCKLNTAIVQLSGLPENSQSGSVVLFHGLTANKVVMTYLARAFADEGLRVYMPDSPGHGQTAGPFSPAQAEECSSSFVRGLMARGMIVPDRTILAGHSMGGAIALRVAAKLRVAGVVAISPAPMAVAHGVSPELLLYKNPPPVAPNSLLLVGALEPAWLKNNAADFAATSTDGTSKFVLVPGNSHVSVLFSPRVAKMAQEWAAKVLNLPATRSDSLPFRGNLLGGLLGLLGILVLAGPFIKETMGDKQIEDRPSAKRLSPARVITEFVIVSLGVVVLLHYWLPLRVLHLFEGDYLASFFLLAGLILISLHAGEAQKKFRTAPNLLLGAAVAAFILHLLVTGWLQLTITGAWMTVERWTRFPLFFLAALLFLYALEVVLGPVVPGLGRRRVLFGLGLIVVVWLALTVGILGLHSGEILLALMVTYFSLFFVMCGLGAQLVRRQSGSAVAAAVFSAILLAGFCLVIFPVS